MLSDLRMALRTLRHSPGFTAVAVLSLALGVGAMTTVFGLIDALLLQPLPAADPDALVRIGVMRDGEGFFPFSYPEYRYLREHGTTLSGLIGHQLIEVGLSAGDEPRLVYGELVSADYFDVLGVPMAIGRGFAPEEGARPGSPVVVVGHGLWERELGGDPAAVGRTVRLNGETFTVIGVAPDGFTGTFHGMVRELWLPAMMVDAVMPGDEPLERVDLPLLMLIGRLRDGTSRGQAAAELEGLDAQFAGEHPELDAGGGRSVAVLAAAGVHPFLAGLMTFFLSLLMAIVGLVLLVACANLAGLLLARGIGRRREIGIRLALGAGRWRVVRHLLSESLIIALAGGACGLLLAAWSVRLLRRFRPPTDVPLGLDLALDYRGFLFGLGVAMIAAAVFGLAPALATSGTNPARGLHGTPSDWRGRPSRLRGALVTGQVAMAMVLLVGGGLLARSLANSRRLDPGFRTDGLYMMRVGLEQLRYDLYRSRDFYAELVDRAAAVPGVSSAAIAGWIPLGDRGDSVGVEIEGREPPPGQPSFAIGYDLAGAGLIEALQMPVLRGRSIAAGDDESVAPVAVINETMARRFWPGEEALGKRIRLRGEETPREVVGIVADAKYGLISETPQPYLFLPWRQYGRYDLTLVVTVAGDPETALEGMRRTVRAMGPDLPLYDVRPLAEAIRFSIVPIRVAGAVLGAGSLIALLLATIGVYGVVAFQVAQRLHEIGIRMALGARRIDVVGLVVRRGLRSTLWGIVLGGLGSIAATRLIAGLLYGVTPSDPLTIAAIALLLVAVSVAASLVPSRRATSVDPSRALHAE